MGRPAKNLIGMKFGRLTVLKRVEPFSYPIYWRCICDCGNEVTVRGSHLKDEHVRSCGCLAVDTSTTHGLSNHRIYNIWCKMLSRCNNSHNNEFHNYGARGIKICDEWQLNFMSFYNWSMKNGYSDNLTIDRIDNNGNYEPNNCRWTTAKEQANNRRSNKLLEYNGEIKTIAQWCEMYSLNYWTTLRRYNKGWKAKEILFGR